MSRTAFSAAVAVTIALVASGCGTDVTTGQATMTSATTTTSVEAAPTRERVAPRADAEGPNPTIASYIADNGITETSVRRGDPGSPTIDLPVPDGWEPAGDDTPDWAYGAIIYTGPEGAEYTPSIVALMSKLTGDVDPQTIIDLAPGELENLPGWDRMTNGRVDTLGEYPAYQLAGTWRQDGQTKVVAQKTAVIPAADGLYVLQLNVDGLEEHMDILEEATDVIDDQTTISF